MPDQPRVLVAHALTVHAEPLAAVLAELRPRLLVHRLAPEELDTALAVWPGAVVVTDRLTPAVRERAGGWLLYLPDDANVAVVGGRGAPRRLERPTLAEVVAAIEGLLAAAEQADRPE